MNLLIRSESLIYSVQMQLIYNYHVGFNGLYKINLIFFSSEEIQNLLKNELASARAT